MTRDNIKEVHIDASFNGDDGWYVSSINTYTAGNDRIYNLLTTDPGFSMWVDYNEAYLYPYVATGHILTRAVVSNCVAYVKVEAKTGNEYSGAFLGDYSENHVIVLELEDGSTIQAELEGPMVLNTLYSIQLHFASRFKTTRCLKSTDITAVYLKTQPGGRDGWYIASVSTFVQSGVSKYEQITNDPDFNKWLDSSDAYKYPYDATQHRLTWTLEDTPDCGYGKPVCECSKHAKACKFNLEIDEIRTFTSYQKFPLGSGLGMHLRGTHGVIMMGALPSR